MARRPLALIDATALPRDRGGVGRFLDAVVSELAGSARLDIAVACQARDAEHFSALGVSTVCPLPAGHSSRPRRLIWEQSGLPRLARQLHADVIFSPHYTFPLLARTPVVVEVHDLTFFTIPSAHSRLKRAFFSLWIRLGKFARKPVVTPSETTAAELQRIIGTPASQITVAQLGVDVDTFHPPRPDDLQRLAAAVPQLPRAWVAFLGTLEPRKNVPALIDAYCRATQGVTDAPALLLAGGAGWDAQVEPAMDRARRAGADIRTLGYLPADALAAFLGGATVVAYPSLGEGFGLPVLEAMACGACVLTTEELSLSEVGGDAVAYTTPDAQTIAERLRQLLGNPDERARLARLARERSAEFTWDRTARSVEDALLSAAGGHA